MKFVVIHNIYVNGGNLGPYSGPSCGYFEHEVVKICTSRMEAEEECEKKFNNFSCKIQEIPE